MKTLDKNITLHKQVTYKAKKSLNFFNKENILQSFCLEKHL